MQHTQSRDHTDASASYDLHIHETAGDCWMIVQIT